MAANAFAQRRASISSSMSNHKNDNSAADVDVDVDADAACQDKDMTEGLGGHWPACQRKEIFGFRVGIFTAKKILIYSKFNFKLK